MKLFENCVVYSKTFPDLNGLTVKKTIKWCYTGDPDGTLYEVQLSDGKTYQLYEDEMVKEK
jgi:hypothetical protein